eukprot:TRINITY_DN1517_c0_g1_i5.p2 TRINITY_DN1517_c0_g1~~TRINITY_DN1517_c0_g1_i5.p2  ORF type:complete len:168 (+),score=34.39 TRINITY_DN1517_c0_g1_i5:62-505(+)
MCIRDRYDVLGLNGFFDIGTPDWLGKQSSSLMPPLSKPYIKDKEQMEKHEKFINEIDETLHNHLLSFNVKGTDHPMRETSTIIDEHHYENEYHRMLDERRHTALIAAVNVLYVIFCRPFPREHKGQTQAMNHYKKSTKEKEKELQTL